MGERFFFFKQKTAYEIRKGDWSSDVCSSDLAGGAARLSDLGFAFRAATVSPSMSRKLRDGARRRGGVTEPRGGGLMTLRYRTPRAGAALTLLWGLMMTTPAFAQATRDTLGFNGAGADTGVAEPAGPPGERWSLARAVAAALEGSVDARAAHARTLQARGSALSAWSGILPSLTGNLSYNHSIPDQRTSTYVVQDSSGAQTTFLVRRSQAKVASATLQSNLFSVPAWSEKRRQEFLS